MEPDFYVDIEGHENLYEDDLYEDSVYEDELEFEDNEFDFSGDGLYEDELYEDELYEDSLYEDEFYEDGLYEDGEYEADPFLGKMLRKAGGIIKKGAKALWKNPAFKNLARTAVSVLGGVIGGPVGAKIGKSIAAAVIREAEFESEAEAENELYESDLEFEDMGGDEEAFNEMEDAAIKASQTDNEMEASRFIARMVKQTPRLLRTRKRRMRTIYPKLIRASAAVAKTMRANPKTRPAIRLLPIAVRRTIQQLAKYPRITDRLLIQTFARNVAWVLANQRRARASLRQQKARRRGRRPTRRTRRRSSL